MEGKRRPWIVSGYSGASFLQLGNRKDGPGSRRNREKRSVRCRVAKEQQEHSGSRSEQGAAEQTPEVSGKTGNTTGTGQQRRRLTRERASTEIATRQHIDAEKPGIGSVNRCGAPAAGFDPLVG